MDAEDDRLSDLQDDLILKILSFTGLKDAIGTSMLSPKWRYMWTSIPHLSFSSEDFPTMDKLSDFVTCVLSRRNNQVQLSSFKLYLCGNDGQDVVQKIMNQSFSLNVQQINVTCSFKENVGFTLYLPSSQDLKYLTLSRSFADDYVTLTPTGTGELSSLTTLHLDYITLYDGFFSKCPNLENLTLNCCKMPESKGLRISHPQLSNLTVENTDFFNTPTVIVATPQLRNLTISQYIGVFHISAPQLTSFLFKGSAPTIFSTDGFHCLEKAELSMHTICGLDAHIVSDLLLKISNVKHLSLSMEIILILNSSLELISRQPSPFANLKSLKILSKGCCMLDHKHTKVIMSTAVKNYLLNSSPKATLTELMREQCCEAKTAPLPFIRLK